MSIISHLEIVKFRYLPSTEIAIGDALTVIAGYNATSKSTLLGLLGQPFGKEKDIDPGFIDIFGNYMKTEFSEIFRMSATKDVPKEHHYIVGLKKDFPPHGTSATVKSRPRGGECRLVTGLRHEKGWGNLPVPVIYLGLRRLYPLGELKGVDDFNVNESNLSKDEATFFKEWYSILTGEDSNHAVEEINNKSKIKQTLTLPTDDYDSSVISAGQDNIGRILAAIISFWRQTKNPNYEGGILLIDEVDASLHPSGQRRLIDLFLTARIRFKVQTIVTTHSLCFLEYFYDFRPKSTSFKKYAKENPNAFKIIYITKTGKQLQVHQQPTWDFINDTLQERISKYEKPSSKKKVDIYLEDEEARLILETILPSHLKPYFSIQSSKWGENELLQMSKIQKLKNCIFIVDGDHKNKKNAPQNFCGLPGSDSPERELLRYLLSLDETDSLWTENFNHRILRVNKPSENDRDSMKDWFICLKASVGTRKLKDMVRHWLQSHSTLRKESDELVALLNQFAKAQRLF